MPLTMLPPKALAINEDFYSDNRPDGWNDGEQHQTFLELLKISDYAKRSFTGASVLDVGCGTGKLLSVLARNDIKSYVGIDILKSALTTAEKEYDHLTFPTHHFLLQDPLTWETPEQFDFVFASGALSLNLSELGIDNYDFLDSMVRKMWSLTRYGLVFNFLSDEIHNPGTSLFFYFPERVMNTCQTLNPKASLQTSASSLGDLQNVHLYLYNAAYPFYSQETLKPNWQPSTLDL